MVMVFVAEVVVVPSLTVSLKRTVPGVAGAVKVGVRVVGLLIVTESGSAPGSGFPAPSTWVHRYVSVCAGVVSASVAVPEMPTFAVLMSTNAGPPLAVTTGAVFVSLLMVKLIVVDAPPPTSVTVRRMKIGLAPADGIVTRGCASAEVAVVPPKMQ